MMNQPELGKKIVDLRKAKGYTQEELVDKCNLSVRTLQRIEAGEATPRTYTIKLIFTALDYPMDNLLEKNTEVSGNPGAFSIWLEQVYRYVFELFNLKKNPMKKITLLTIILVAVGYHLFAINKNDWQSHGVISAKTKKDIQTAAEVKKIIEDLDMKYMLWYNSGMVDSLMTKYSKDVCLVNNWSTLNGKTNVRDALIRVMPKGHKILDMGPIESFTYANSVVVIRGTSVARLGSGEILKTRYLDEWHLINDKWLMVNSVEVAID